MNAATRRQQILELLRQTSQPLSATAIASRFSVSRQIIVGDIALLRAAGERPSRPPPRGYLLERPGGQPYVETRIVCEHGDDALGPRNCTP